MFSVGFKSSYLLTEDIIKMTLLVVRLRLFALDLCIFKVLVVLCESTIFLEVEVLLHTLGLCFLRLLISLSLEYWTTSTGKYPKIVQYKTDIIVRWKYFYFQSVEIIHNGSLWWMIYLTYFIEHWIISFYLRTQLLLNFVNKYFKNYD